MTIRRDLELLDRLATKQSERGLLPYLSNVVIDSVPPRLFREVGDSWQWDYYGTLAPALERTAGYPPSCGSCRKCNPGGQHHNGPCRARPYEGPDWFWRGMPRGHDKTSGLGRIYHWLLGWSRRRLTCVHVAGDSDQGQLLRQSMEHEAAHNPWIRDRVKWNKHNQCYGPGGTLYLLSADGWSNFGLNPDVVSCDELTHWMHLKGEKNWGSLYSTMAKRPGSVLLVITNAGVLDTWQHKVRERARVSKKWHHYEVPAFTTLAKWMDADKIAEIVKGMTPAEAKRVIGNLWINAAEDCGYLTEADVYAIDALGQDLGLVERQSGIDGIRYYLSVDYGPKRDRTALAVLHRAESGLVIVDRLDVLQGSPETPISVATVSQWLGKHSELFGPNPDIIVDPYQMIGTIEAFEGQQSVTRHEARGGKGNYEMAECLRSLVVNKMIAWYPGCGRLLLPDDRVECLSDELKSLITKRMVYGYRFDHESGKHDDRAVAIGMGCLLAAPDYNPTWVGPKKIEVVTAALGDRKLPERHSSINTRGLYGL